MKETISLLAVTLAVLIISGFSFKNVSNVAASTSLYQGKTNTEAEYKSEKTEKASKSGKQKKKSSSTKNSEDTSTQQAEAEAPAESQQAEPQQEQQAEQPAPVVSQAPAPVQAVVPPPAPLTRPDTAPVQQYSAEQNTAGIKTASGRLNAAILHPTYTPYYDLNDEINRILSQIIRNDMSNYEKIKACYQYIIDTCSEGRLQPQYRSNDMYRKAYGLFMCKTGMCDCYSAAFTVLARAVGLDVHQVEGDIPGFTDHDWCEATIGGVRYMFDVDVEEDDYHAGREYYFCKTYEERPKYTYKRTLN